MMESNKLVVVLKDKLETGRAMNALAHAMLGFGTGVVTGEEVKINHYVDADGSEHNNISQMPIVVLKASSGKIRNLRKWAMNTGVRFVDFVDTMSTGTYEEEYALTKTRKDDELDYWAIILFGDREMITEWTGKFSLYR